MVILKEVKEREVRHGKFDAEFLGLWWIHKTRH